MIYSIDIVHERIDMADFSEKCVLFRDLPNRTVLERLKDALHDKYPGLEQHEHNFCKVDLQDSSACIALFKSQKDVEHCIKDGVFHCEHEGQTVQLTPDFCSDCLIPEEWKNEMSYDFVTSMRTVSKGQSNATMMQVDDDDSFLSQELFGSSKGHVSNPKLSASEQSCLPSKRFDSHEYKDLPSVIDAKNDLPSTGKEEEILFRTSSYQTEPKEQAISRNEDKTIPHFERGASPVQTEAAEGPLPGEDSHHKIEGQHEDLKDTQYVNMGEFKKDQTYMRHVEYSSPKNVNKTSEVKAFSRPSATDSTSSTPKSQHQPVNVASGQGQVPTSVGPEGNEKGMEVLSQYQMTQEQLAYRRFQQQQLYFLHGQHTAPFGPGPAQLPPTNTYPALGQVLSGQGQEGQLSAGQVPPATSSGDFFSQFPPGLFPPWQFPPGQFPPGQFPPGQCPPGQFPTGQFTPGQLPTGQYAQQLYYSPWQAGPGLPGSFPMWPTGFPFSPGPPTLQGQSGQSSENEGLQQKGQSPKTESDPLSGNDLLTSSNMYIHEDSHGYKIMKSRNAGEETTTTALCSLSLDASDYAKIDDDMLRSMKTVEEPRTDQPGQILTPQKGRKLPELPENAKKQLVTSKGDKPESKKLPEISAGSKVNVTSTDPTNQDTAEEEMTSCCIRVKGLPENITEDNLSLLFESKKAGGGTVTGVDIDKTRLEAVVEFEKASDVQRVLQMQETKPVKLSQCTLEIEEYQPPPQDQHKLFLSGIKVGTTEDCLSNFVEVTCKVPPSEMIWGGQPGTALLLFEEPQDVKMLREKCQSRQLENQLLCATVIPVNNCVKLEGLSERTTTDSVTYFFESRRGGNRDVDRVELRADSKCLVFFKRHEDALSLVEEGEPINIENSTVAVSFFYDFMEGSASNEHRGNVGNKRNMGGADFTKTSIPQPLQLDISKQLVRFLENAKTYRDGFETKMTEKKAVVIWPTQKGSPLVLECLSQRELEVASVSIATWETDCREAVADFMSRLCEEDVQVTKEVWESVRKRVSEISFSHPDAVALSINNRALSWTIVGQKQLVSKLKVQIETIVSDEETRSIAESQEITKKRTLKNYQIILLNLSSLYVKEVEDSGVSVLVDKREIVFSGRKNDVDKALSKLEKLFESFQYKSKCVTLQCKELLFCKETQDYLKRQFRDHKVIGVWDMIPQSDGFIMHVYSRKEQDAATAFGIIERSLVEKALPLDESMSKLIRDKDGYSMLQELSVRFDGSLMFHVKPDSLYYITTDLKEKKVTAEIQSFFDRHSIVSEFIKLSTGVLRYLQEHLRHIETQYQVLDVTIKVIDNPVQPGIRVTGKRDGCHMAVRKIQELKGSVLHEEYKVKGPDVTDFSSNSKVYDEMRYLEMEHKCVLEVDTTDNSSSNSGPSSAEKSGEKASVSFGSGSIVVWQGDITELSLEDGCLVNPTDKFLSNDFGLSGAIMKKAGSHIKQVCSDYIKKRAMADGTALSTKGGNLKAKYIGHAVVPVWRGGSREECCLLAKAITQCLLFAGDSKLSCIAIPSVAGAVFKFPLNKSSEVIVKAVQSYFNMQPGSSIQKVYLADLKPETADGFVHALTQTYGHRKVKDTGAGGSHRSAGRYEEDMEVDEVMDNNRRQSPRRRQISSATGATISISVITGELAKQQADVLVNSTNQNLDLVVGTISKSLLKIGGSSIQQDCKANYPIGIRPGQVAVSVAGQLKCHQVFHGCLVCWDQGKGTAKKVMRTFIDGCLDEADRQKFSSLSFPALGTGILKFPVDIVARLMFDCVEAFGSANAGTSLQQVNFVVYPSDLAAVKAFQHEENRRSITSGSGWSSSPTRLNRRTSAFAEIAAPSGQSSHYEFNIGGLRIEVCQGDLTNETSHVIVNSVQSDLDLSQGAVSQAILKKAGRSVQEECFKHQNVTRMDKDRLITTGPGRLPCQHIIHAKARSKASNWETTVGKCLEEAEKLGVSSIAFPALGTGGKGCAPEEVAKAMFNAIKQFAKSKTIVCLKTVRILIFQKEMVDQFVTAATDGNPGFFGAEKDLLKISPKEGSRSEVRIHVYFGSRHSFSQIRRNLDQICIMEKVEKIMHPSISLMKDITKEQEIFFQDIGRKRNVMVEMSAHSPYRYITLQGAEKDVLTIEEALGRCFQQMEKEQLQSGGTAVRLPKNWSKRTLMDSVRAVPLSGMDQEYIDVSAKLRASGYVTIRLIERIQNPTLYTQYIAKKHEMERSCITKPIERYLWHGTSGTAVRNIVNTGFNRSYNSGGSLGCGVYFAVNPATSISGYCLPDVAGQKHIFFTKVLTGDFCLGSGGIKVPPRKNPRNSDSMAIFDSTTDNQAAPNLFAIFHDAQAYPGYHITFT